MQDLADKIPLPFLITATWLALLYILIDRLTGLSLSNGIPLLFRELKEFLKGKFTRGAVNGAMFVAIAGICAGYLGSQGFRELIQAATTAQNSVPDDSGNGPFYASVTALIIMGIGSLLVTRTRR